MTNLIKLYFEYKTRQLRTKLLSKALDQRKWILSQRRPDEGVVIAEIDYIISKLGKANLN